MSLSILYRGHLSSCNYDCGYCPFAKRSDTAAQLRRDREQLARFVKWVTGRNSETRVFFTPWGEALTRSWYREAVIQLSRQPHVTKVAAQTNLSCALDWVGLCDVAKLGMWCTFHPSQTTLADFVGQCDVLRDSGVAFSVGAVGIPSDFDAIESLRDALPDDIYLWINAWDVGDGEKYEYAADDLARLEAVDPLFATNIPHYESRGKACQTGTRVISVDGEGNVTRCHFVRRVLGNIYDPTFGMGQGETSCPNATCSCHIGYVHLEHLELDAVYGDRLLERIPLDWPPATAEL